MAQKTIYGMMVLNDWQGLDFINLTDGDEIIISDFNPFISGSKTYVKIKYVYDSGNVMWNVTYTYSDGTTSTTTLQRDDIDQEWNTWIRSIVGDTLICKMYYNVAVDSVAVTLDNIMDITTNCIFLYRLRGDKKQINKNPDFVENMEISYTRPINYKSMIIDMKRTISDKSFNYVYLTVLNRFYFVTDITLINDILSVGLREDVLESWKDLIRLQSGFVERNRYDYDMDKVDDYVYTDFNKAITYTTITPTLDLFGVNDSEDGYTSDTYEYQLYYAKYMVLGVVI